MDVLNFVMNVLHLLVDVISLTWVISKDIFQGDSSAKHYSHDKK